MTELPNLKRLTHEAKDALIQSLWEEIQQLRTAAEKKPKKTSKNSSLPPAQGFKPSAKPKPSKSETQRTRSLGRKGGGRPLAEAPDQFIKFYAQQCNSCGAALSPETQQLLERYDKIEIPPIRPLVTRVERYGCACAQCGIVQSAQVPEPLSPGSPFGPSVAALVTTLRYTHAISYGRMSQLMQSVFGLKISQGAIANLFLRVKEQLKATVDDLVVRLRQSSVIGSDETSARVNGRNQWEWVFQNREVCMHVIRPSRGSEVIEEVLGGHQPEVWVSDLFSAQRKHPAPQWQVCLAHQLRDCQYGIDAGDEIFSPRMKQIFEWAIAVGHRWERLSASTRTQYLGRLYRQLDAALELCPIQEDGVRLQNRYWDLRENLFVFLENTTVPPTNNDSEQALRLSVIFRKVTNGFRSEWGRDLFADVRSIINTGRRQGLSAFQSIATALNPAKSLFYLS